MEEEKPYFIKKACKHCPFRKDVKPFLTTEFAEELAYSTENPYNSFPCHKTTEHDDDCDDMQVTESSLECAGFITMQMIANGEEYCPKGFAPEYEKIYGGSWDMIEAYENREE